MMIISTSINKVSGAAAIIFTLQEIHPKFHNPVSSLDKGRKEVSSTSLKYKLKFPLKVMDQK
jgi:hypothetical protein